MNPGVVELRWGYVVLALLVTIDFFVALLVTGHARLILLGLLLTLQLLLLWIMQRVIRVVRNYRQVKEAYEQELSLAQQVMDSSNQGMLLLDAQGRFAFANETAARFMGLSAKDLLGREPKDFLNPEDQVMFQQQLKERWTGKQSSYVLHLRHAGGHTVTVQVRGTPRWHQGRIVGNFATITALEPRADELQNLTGSTGGVA